ncbi:unnamed protein product [Allacma fusca]|uniref:Major facilitator superfamily (MFS) profile domain-containing protein n=1 Tax=Allacma fusca TaxID=39272 RepID=A0A8J2PT28_9HEXA|nr:unnamed protein product [Allacma fusca]
MGKERDLAKPVINNVEDVLDSLGGFGRFQFMILVLVLFLEIPIAFVVFVPVFIGAAPSEWLCDTRVISRFEACSCNGTLSALDPDMSVVSEWNLVCEASWVADTVVSFQMAGMVVGNLFVTQLADWYGRRYCFLGITIEVILGSVLTALAPNPYVYAIARFMCGAGFCGFLSISAIYAMEFLTPQYRVLASVGPFGEGIMLLGLVAYLIRPWRSLVWVTILPFFAIAAIFPFIPESPRWLLRNQRIEECSKSLNYIARVNGKEPIDVVTLKHLAQKESSTTNQAEDGQVKRTSYIEFFKDPELRKTALILQGIWFSWGVVYFGLSYNIKNMAGSPYLNIMYMGLADALGYPSAVLLNKFVGRRQALVSFMTLAAIFLVSIAILQLTADLSGKEYVVAILCLIGKFGTAGARTSARTLTGESFPTSVRTMGLGIAGVTGSIGAAVSPQLAYIGTNYPSVPFFVFALISVLGSVVSFLLKETSGEPMREETGTVKETPEEMGRKVSISTIISANEFRR